MYDVPPCSLAVDDWISGGHHDMTMHTLWKYQEDEAFNRGCRTERSETRAKEDGTNYTSTNKMRKQE